MIAKTENVKAFRSELDKELIEKLFPLQKHGATVYFPFFANTFPLAFHYSCLLADNEARDQIDQRIKLISWGDERRFVKRKIPRSPLVFYSTLKTIGKATNLTPVLVTDFLPCLVFSEFNLKVWAVSNPPEEGGESPKANLKDIVKVLVQEKTFDNFEVFTEIPEQAKALFKELFGELNLKYDIVETTSAKWLFDETHLCQNTLRLFLYGAPLTNYLSHKRQRFIPFKVRLDGARESFLTVIAVKGADKARKAIAKAMEEYHCRLYKAAQEETENDRQAFRTVQYHYNRVARLLQHRSSFLSSQEYAKCLAEHHQAPGKQNGRSRRQVR